MDVLGRPNGVICSLHSPRSFAGPWNTKTPPQPDSATVLVGHVSEQSCFGPEGFRAEDLS